MGRSSSEKTLRNCAFLSLSRCGTRKGCRNGRTGTVLGQELIPDEFGSLDGKGTFYDCMRSCVLKILTRSYCEDAKRLIGHSYGFMIHWQIAPIDSRSRSSSSKQRFAHFTASMVWTRLPVHAAKNRTDSHLHFSALSNSHA